MIENSEYSFLYQRGPVRVGLILRRTNTGGGRNNANLQLEGIIRGETRNTLVFESLKAVNCYVEKGADYVNSFDGGKSSVPKSSVAVIYEIMPLEQREEL